GRISDIGHRLRLGEVLRVRVIGDEVAIAAARDWFRGQVDVASSELVESGEIEIGFRGDDSAAAGLLARAVGAELAISYFGRAATDLQELFLQVTGQDRAVPAGETVVVAA